MKELEINREIARIECIFPQNDIIKSYKDFLKHRDFLHFYQYNPFVFSSLIELTYNLWNSNHRINRTSLISVSKRYLKKSTTKSTFSRELVSKIFYLFKDVVYYENLKLSKKTIYELKKAINSIMIGVELNEAELLWLTNHTDKSNFVLNRVLRYQKKSKSISNWAMVNFEKDYVRSRRAEIASWIIDENHNFVIDKKTVEYDLLFQLQEDEKMAEKYIDEMDAYLFLEKELRPLITEKEDSFFDKDGFEYKPKIQEKPEYKWPRRHFAYISKMNPVTEVVTPNFERTKEDYYKDFDIYYNRIMTWSIAYSRIPITEKIKLLEKYYSDNIYSTFLHIGKTLNSTEYYKWLKELV